MESKEYSKVFTFDDMNPEECSKIEKDMNALYVSIRDSRRYVWDGLRFCVWITDKEYNEMISAPKQSSNSRPNEINIIQSKPCEFSILWGLIKIKF
jgi:Trm5-related predicted tRNA methylase